MKYLVRNIRCRNSTFVKSDKINISLGYYHAISLGSNYAVNEQDFRWWVVHEFERHGWQVECVYLGNPMRQDEKYLLINQAFAGKQRLMPFFNSKTTLTTFSLYKPPASLAVAPASGKIKQARN